MATHAPGGLVPHRPRFPLRLALYRAARSIAGPILAHRVAFGFKGVARG